MYYVVETQPFPNKEYRTFDVIAPNGKTIGIWNSRKDAERDAANWNSKR